MRDLGIDSTDGPCLPFYAQTPDSASGPGTQPPLMAAESCKTDRAAQKHNRLHRTNAKGFLSFAQLGELSALAQTSRTQASGAKRQQQQAPFA